jgi:hypothetical protein
MLEKAAMKNKFKMERRQCRFIHEQMPVSKNILFGFLVSRILFKISPCIRINYFLRDGPKFIKIPDSSAR